MILAHTPDWGNVPAWVGSVLSGVSVLLALSIIFRDRRKADRYQADRITYWEQQYIMASEPWRRHVVRIGVRNSGDRPVYDLWLRARPITEKAIRRLGDKQSTELDRVKQVATTEAAEFETYKGWLSIEGRLMTSGMAMKPKSGNKLDRAELLPEQSATLDLQLVLPFSWYQLEIVFRDGANVRWRRSILTHKLRRDWPQGKRPARNYSDPSRLARTIYRLTPGKFEKWRQSFIKDAGR